MMLTKYKLDQDNWGGIGIYAAEPIKKNSVVYVYNESLIKIFSLSDVYAMSDVASDAILKYSYSGMGQHKLEGAVYYGMDDSRFMNHSAEPSLIYNESNQCYHAARDLIIGEELTCDYNDFCERGSFCFNFW
jgi:uncharacterized protein